MLLPDAASGLCGLALLGGSCILPVVVFLLWLMLCVWVYRDAQERGMDAAIWLLIVLLTGPVGLIVYLIVRKD